MLFGGARLLAQFTAPNEPVGTSGPTDSATITFSGSFTLGSISVVTGGYTGLDFKIASGSTCTVSTIYASGNSCTVNYTFTPTAVGVRLGAILIYDTSGNLQATQYISGLGLGPVLQFIPASVSTIAGTGSACSGVSSVCGDGGLATAANISDINSIAFDAQGNTYLLDLSSYVIRKITKSTGVISTIIGTENSLCPSPTSACGDGGPGTSALLSYPSKLAIDGAGNLYISDKGDNRIRVYNLMTGKINTFAGTGTACPVATGTCGDGGTAVTANLKGPDGLAIDTSGNVYIGDTADYKVRKVNIATGIISTIAGTGVQCNTGVCGNGGPASAAQIAYPNELHFDTSGNLYMTDSTANRLREILISNGTVGNIVNIAGSGSTCSNPTGGCGDGGLATDAQLNTVWGFSIDGASNIYIVDNGDYKIRFVNSTTGIISTVMGNGTVCSPTTASCGDGGTGTSATL